MHHNHDDNLIRRLIRCARIYLWPVIFTNTMLVAFTIDIPLLGGLRLASSLCGLASFGFLINDLCDVAVDRVNSADRLENAPRSSRRWILACAVLTAIAAIWIVWSESTALVPAAGLVAAGLVLYSLVARPWPIVANVLASCMIVSPMWVPHFHPMAAPSLPHLLLTIVAAVFVFAREIMLDLKDRVGDRAAGRCTIATILFPRATVAVAASLWLLACIGYTGIVCGIPTTVNNGGVGLVVNSGILVMLALPALILLRREPINDDFQQFITISRISMVAFPCTMLLI